MNEQRKRVPTWVRFWTYPRYLRGLPGITFWRPVLWDSVAAGGGVFLLLLAGRRWIAPQDITWAVYWHIGLPALVGWVAGKARLQGKRLDQWLLAYLLYRLQPKVHDRYRAAPERGTRYTINKRRPWR